MWLNSIKISHSHSLHTHFCCSIAQSCLTLCNLMSCSKPGFLAFHYLPEFAQTRFHWVIMPYNHLILCHPFLLLLSIFPHIRVFSNKSALHIRWPKCWSFSFSISPSNEYSELFPLIFTGLISSLPKEGFSTTVQKKQFFSAQLSLWFISPIYIRLLEKQKLWLYRPLSAKWCLCLLICCLSLS